MKDKLKNFLVFLCAFLLGGLVMYLLVEKPFINGKKTIDSNNTNTASAETKVIVENNGISAAVDKVYDAVVMVENYKNKKLAGTGSGFVYKTDKEYGYIMTNYHVVKNNTSLRITFSNEKSVEATYLGGDEYLDVAIIKVPVKYVVKKANIGDSSKLKQGDVVFTIGSPVGKVYFNSVTSGIISGLDRLVTVSINTKNDWVMKVIQVDAAINPGNSGGALLNSNGEVIGVNSMKLVDSSIEGMGFALKIEDAMAHIDAFESGKKIDRPFLGISYCDVSDVYTLYRQGINISNDLEEGIVVVDVVKATGAEKAGLKKGDIITKINSEKLTSSAYLKYLLYKYNVGDKLKISIVRDGKEKELEIELSKSSN